MKLYNIIQEQEEEETPKKIREITQFHKKMLNALSRMGVDDDSYPDIWREVRDVFQIDDDDLAQEISFLYYEFSDQVFDEDEKDGYKDLPLDALSEFNEIGDFPNKEIALSNELGVPPFLLEEDGWNSYGLEVYEDLTDGSKYSVGTDDEANEAMVEWAEEYYNNEGIEYMDRYYLDDFIELNDISTFVDEEVDYRLGDMSDNDIIEGAGYDKDDMENKKELLSSKTEELSDDMETILNEVEELQVELDDMEAEDEDAYETSEYQDIVDQQDELKEQWEGKESEIDDLESQISDLEYEIENVLDTAREELKDEMESDLTSDIENEGVDYFIDNLGYSLSDAINSFCYFDESGFITSLAENEDRGLMAFHDHVEMYSQVNGIDYYMYRIE